MPRIFFLIIFILSWSLQAPSQITIQKSRISVEEVMKEITRQSGMQFSYNPRAIDSKQVISFRVRKASVENALRVLSTKIPIEYSIVENQIVLNRRREPVKEEPEEAPPKEPDFFSISGFITDKTTGESLIGATAYAVGTSAGASTNGFGFYSLKLPKGRYVLEFSYLGYIAQRVEIELGRDETRSAGLDIQPLKLPDVVVQTPTSDLLDKKLPGKLVLKPGDLAKMPEFGGESGLVKNLEALPGIASHSDGSAFFYVRGGERDQNLLIIDDAPVYNPAHLFGFYSMVVPDFTKDIKVHKSDIPVHLGDRLSSIVDVRTRDGNLQKWEFGGAFNPLLFQLSLEGPLKKDKSSIFLSTRQSAFQWIYQRVAPNLALAFGDFHFKWNYKINNNNRLYFTLVNGRDELNNAGTGILWNNFAMTLRWNRIYSAKLFSNTTLYTGNYQYRLSAPQDIWHSGIASLSLKSDYTFYASPRLTTRMGIEAHGYNFNPGRLLASQLLPLFPTISQDNSSQLAWYFNADYHISEKWRLNAGARWSVWTNLGPAQYYTFGENYEVADTVVAGTGAYNRYFRPDPRLSLQYNPDTSSSIKLSYGLYHQFIQLISNSTSPFTSFEVWLPSSPNLRPQQAHQAALGYVKHLPKQGLELSAEAYYKYMSNQIDYESHAQTLLNPLIEGELRPGKLQAYGLELMLRKDQGRLNGWIAYTYSRAIRQTPGVNSGRSYPAFQDRPHDLSVMLNYSLSRRTIFSAYWTMYTGSAFSSPTGWYDFMGQTVPIYGEKNNDRLPDYRRLDIAFKFILNKRPENRFQHSLTFSVYNALAHRNIVAVNFNKTLQANGTPVVRANWLAEEALVATQADLIRFMPSVTYKFVVK
jgi:hypothetical protein